MHLLLLLLPLLASAGWVNVSVSNTALRRTVSGAIVGAQDGNIANARFNNNFVLMGMSYGDCPYQGCKNESYGACGFGAGRFLAWLSPTLGDGSWADAPIEILPASSRPPALARAIFFRPHLLYNAATRQWVLWVRYLPPAGPTLADDPTLYLSATAPSLDAPFTIAQLSVPCYYNNSADNSLFVDPAEPSAAYLIHTSRSTGTRISVERLSADWTWSRGFNDSAARSELVGPGGTEAPALAWAGGRYLLTMSPLCCYCASGSPTLTFAAPRPLGPYAPLGSGLGNAPRAQQTFLFADPALLQGGVALWAGNRWGSDPIHPAAPLFDYSLQYWALLQLDASGAALAPLAWQDSITLTVFEGAKEEE
jgi:hypothetical protein